MERPKLMNKDSYGIKMKEFCREHEAWLTAELAKKGPSQELLDIHLEKLRWLQHERLVHLIVMCVTIACELVSLCLSFIVFKTWVSLAVTLVILIVLFFYIFHYFFLENTTQHWYRLAEEIMEGLEDKR